MIRPPQPVGSGDCGCGSNMEGRSDLWGLRLEFEGRMTDELDIASATLDLKELAPILQKVSQSVGLEI